MTTKQMGPHNKLTHGRGQHALDALLALGHRRRLVLHLPHRHHVALQLCGAGARAGE